MGIFLGRAVRAAMGAIVWGAIAVGMYAILRGFASDASPFDAVGEFVSIIAALFKAAGAVISGVGFEGVWFLMPALPGQEGFILLVAAVVRFVEIIALAIAAAALVRVIAVIFQGIKYSRP